MNTPLAVDLLFWLFAASAVVSAWRVFRADSMMRAAYWLLASFAGVAAIFPLLGAEFLGFILILMMAGEMTIMVVFMVMFMMNPAGLNPMTMVHQHRVSIGAGVVTFLGLAAVALFAPFPDAPLADATNATAELGRELLGESMVVFQTAGVALLSTMIGTLALAAKRGRFGDADEGSVEPSLVPGVPEVAQPAEPEEDEHAGHAGMEMDGMEEMEMEMEAGDEHAGHGGHG